MNLSAVILAAGKGTRMKSNLPKVMHKLAAKPMVWLILEMLKRHQIDDTAIVVGPDAKILKDYLIREFGEIKQVTQAERLGTAHATREGIQQIDNKNNNVAILFGDTPFIDGKTLYKMNELIDEKTALVVLSFITTDPSRYGRIITDNNNELAEIVEYNEASDLQRKINLCNSGVMLLNQKAISLLDKINNKNSKNEFYLTDIVKIAKENGWIVKQHTVDEDEVLGINCKKDLAYAESVIQSKLRAKMLENGVTLVDPEKVFFAADTVIESDAIIQPNVYFGPGVIIHHNVEIKSFSHIEGAEIFPDSVIGPFARIRPGTNISSGAKIGNFVETKNANIGKNSKISHLSYIGDSEIGEEVNIGAGTITCNYDGYNKFTTIIEDEAFIGSNTSLVAPVTIGKGSIIGAGSVVTKNTQENSLVIARGEEKSFPGKANSIRARAKATGEKITDKGKKL